MGDGTTGPGRPRDPDLTPRVLAAALDVYARTGWAAFTLDAVARQARVGKAALYRRWPTKDHLLFDAIEAHTQPLVATDTGSLHGDTRALASALLEHFLYPAGWVTLRIEVDASTEPATFARFHEKIVAMHRDGAERMVQRAIDRGELPSGIHTRSFTEALYGAVLMHALSMTQDQREQARHEVAEHVTPIVDFVLAASMTRAALPD
ncbi:TetR family transcriptional regulator [Actinocorallia herbida]|uniref:TetR family transcriptional regulator n=1 Tax=Actinocorallia herbida TaxID=58109 RepID=A0A3N1D4D7_9ACTN|nr:TetR/AcrR family transcriptional regulator [Actinocorallia herbida]ROO87948.1 TetR family transcriptional regulator [Actinocorallia herbida]